MDSAEAKRATDNPKDPDGVYCYSDDSEAKIRYIVADTSNGVPLNVSQGCRKDIHQNENQMNPQNQGG